MGSLRRRRRRVPRVLVVVLLLAGCDLVFGVERGDAPDAPLPLEAWRQIDGGLQHTCGIRRDDTLWCWGRGEDGQLGRGVASTELEHPLPAQIGGAEWQTVSTGWTAGSATLTNGGGTCAIKLDGTLWCWGPNAVGQVGDGTREKRAEPIQLPGTWAQVASGQGHTCAIDTGGTLSCWGQDDGGRLGDGVIGSPGLQLVPQPIAEPGPWLHVDAGEKSACGIKVDGTLWCWGSNDHGRLGVGVSPSASPVPLQVGTATWKALAVGYQSVCAITTDDRLRCWGSNDSGQLGDRTSDHRGEPTPVDQDRALDWVAVATGAQHTCGLRATGELACWGRNHYGQLGLDTAREQRLLPSAPAPVAGVIAPWAAIGLGAHHTCAIDSAGQLWCTGYAADGALGTGEGSQRTPVAIAGGWESARLGEDATCASTTQGLLTCWGSNRGGLLGLGTQLDEQAPGASDLGSWAAFDLGDHGCAIAHSSAAMSCWGSNEHRQLATGDSGNRASPTPIQGSNLVWSQVASSRSHSCALAGTSVYCWGRNSEQQTGAALSPTPIPNPLVGGWKDVATGIVFSCGLALDGAAHCWGLGGEGQLGTGAPQPPTPTPQPVVGGRLYDDVLAGARHACALVGTAAWCWGWNEFGQLGDGTLMDRATPVALAAPAGWRSLALGEEHTCGIHPDGTLWCWGRNNYGQLGDGSLEDRLVPTRIGDATDWLVVEAGTRHTCATKAGGALWCWGGNIAGALGTGTAWRPGLARITN